MESVDPHTEGETLGIMPGAIIVAWFNDKQGGVINSPFDLAWVELEQKPRGPLSLEGFQAGAKRTWKFATDVLGLNVRPILPDRLAGIHREATALVQGGRLLEAAQLWSNAAHQVAAEDPPWLASWLLIQAAESHAKQQRWKDADPYYEEAVQKCPHGEHIIKAELLHLWALSAMESGDSRRGESLYAAALEQSSQRNARDLIAAQSLDGIGFAKILESDLVKGKEYVQRALEIQQELAPESSAVAESLMWLGSAAMRAGELSRAQQLEEKVIAIDSILAPYSSDISEAWNVLGMVAEQRGDLVHAEEYTSRTLAIGTIIGRYRGGRRAAMLVNLGAIAQDRGDFARAERYLNEAFSIAHGIDPEGGVTAAALNNLGSVLVDEDRFEAGEQNLKEALRIKNKNGPGSRRVASTLMELGKLAFKRGDLTGAADYLNQALTIQRKAVPNSTTIASTLVELGAVALKHAEIQNAEAYYREAASIRQQLAPESAGYGEALGALASIHLRRGETVEAARLYEQAINVLEKQSLHLGGGSEAPSVFRVRHANYYREYVGLLAAQGNVERGFEMLERSRARALLEMLSTAHAEIRKGVDSALLEHQQWLKVDINAKSANRSRLLGDKRNDDLLRAADEDIAELIKQYDQGQARLRESSPEYAALTQPQPLSSKEVRQQLLDPDTVLLEYSLGEERSYVYTVTQDAIISVALPKRADIEAASLHLYQILSVPEGASSGGRVSARTGIPLKIQVGKAAAELSRLVLEPVAKQIKSKRIVVVADGALQYIPFAMLPQPESLGHSVLKQTPLIANQEVVNLPSASVLAVLRRQASGRARPQKLVAVLADPVFSKDDPRVNFKYFPVKQTVPPSRAIEDDLRWQQESLALDLLTRSAQDFALGRDGQLHLLRLPYSRQEAEAIATASPPGTSMAALDFDASLSSATSAELSQYRIVHFATHGLLNSEHPELSGLVFSLVDKDGRPQGGFLQLQDIYNMNLPSDLVVLSACETGLGKEINGEGLIGLTRGFMYAGASRVVASLWKVSDVATARLMAHFYTAMERDGMAPAAALRAAQIRMLKQKRWSSPYYWAAFQIQGEWK